MRADDQRPASSGAGPLTVDWVVSKEINADDRLPRTIWVDVEDLFDYAAANPRPSGIQRLAFAIYCVLHERLGPRVQFVRHEPSATSFRIVPWQAVSALFDDLVSPQQQEAERLLNAVRRLLAGPPLIGRAFSRQNMAGAVRRLPPRVSTQLIRFGVLQPVAWRALRDLGRALIDARRGAGAAPQDLPAAADGLSTAEVPPLPPAPAAPASGADVAAFAARARPQDVVLVLGAPWFHRDYGGLLAAVRARHGIRVALLLYDLIPLRRPEWCDKRLVRQFASWFAGTIPQCDDLFAISRASAEDVALYARQHGLRLPGPVRPIPIGTGFSPLATEPVPVEAPAEEADLALLPEPGSYVLFVSTVEARKNHVLLFRVWRQLLDDLPADRVPTLVFAGRVGWLVADLMQQLENANYLDGKIVLVRDPTDAELRALYAGCLFTVFPSLFEGWGLPVTESLALGRPCVISSCTSLPEAGGSLARYFDPEDTADAYRAIRSVIEDQAGLAAWTERVRREFQPVGWEATATAILDGIAEPAR
ncbi:MAG: glycosyltransferase family 4 protein [Acetobacteraceae bacterium]|nr:glycosyltransferase family 4 protein [Acetobacteraceae bacterium]